MASDIANLRAYLQTMGIYQTSTYSYVKSRPIYAIGYSSGSLQILKGTYLYGGIRDLGATIEGVIKQKDLSVFVKGVITATKDLYGYVNSRSVDDGDLYAYLKITDQTYYNIKAYLKSTLQSYSGISGQLVGVLLNSYGDLNSYLNTVQPVDLSGVVNVIEFKELGAYVGIVAGQGVGNLYARVDRINAFGQSNLSAYICNFFNMDLSASLTPRYYSSLPASIYGADYKDLTVYLFAVPSIDLSAYIHGFATSDLPATIIGGYGPYDIRAYITAVPSQNLFADIDVYKGIKVPYDLRAAIVGVYSNNLSAYIKSVIPINLGAYLNAFGRSTNLPATIYPMVIHLKKILSVALLEHKNLWAMINAHCFSSGFNNLSAYVYPLMKSDLRASLIGWKSGATDRLNDLSACINVGDYFVEDSINVTVFPTDLKTQLKLNYSDNTYKVFDTLTVRFGNFNGSSLSAYIYGMPRAKDLSASVNALQLIPYRQAPEYLKIKTREVVLNLERFEPQWRRVAELFFDNYGGSDPFYYFYVEGEHKVYRLDREKHWIIRAVGYTRAPEDSDIDRLNIWRKYIFDMSKYSTVDDAIRDIIDRVTFLRRSNMSAYINGVLPPHGNLNASISVFKSYYNWVGHMSASIKAFTDSDYDLSCSITGVL